MNGSSTYLSSTGYLQVVFTSDSSANAAGLNSSWKTTRSECLQCPAGKHSTSSQGTSETSCLPCPVLPRNAFYSSKNGIPCSWTCERDYVSNGTSCLPCPGLPQNAYYSTENGIPCRNWTCGQNYFSDGTSCLPCPGVLPRNAYYSSKNGNPCSWTCEREYFSNGTSCLSCPDLAVKGCPVGKYFDCQSGKGCTNCTNGPRGSKYITAGIPITQNKCDWDCSGGGECPDAYKREWFMGPALSSNVFIGALVGWAFILLSGISAICCYPDRKEDIILVMRMVLYVMWFIFDFTFMCARFQWLLNSKDAKFETMSIKTENKQLIWKGPKFDVSSRTERVHAGCNFTAALLERAPKDACKVWWVTFNADIHFQENDWEGNAAKFSVGFGLFIYAIIKMVVLFSVEMMMAAPNDTPHGNFCQRMKKARNSTFVPLGFYLYTRMAIELTYGIGAGPGVIFYNNPYICAAVSCLAPPH